MSLAPPRLRHHLVLVLAAALLLPAPDPVAGQEPAFESGAAGVGLLLRHLDGVKRVLVIGAHPDDEDTSLLAALARGQGVETAYLSLTRGDGGQNLVGPELDEGLGAIRTGELLAARSLDGGRQFFTRAFDYGFSKSAEEAFSNWPREALLRDVVWVVRTFRPQVVVSIFSGTPADGHGQHQAAGIMAREAFRAAGDPTRFPGQIEGPGGVRAWAPVKLYQLDWGGTASNTTVVETGGWDPLLGRSHHQLAMESRSRHRSQDMGQAQPLGPRATTLTLVATASDSTPTTAGDALFQGVDTALASFAGAVAADVRPRFLDAVQRYRGHLRDAEAALRVLDPSPAVPHLASALGSLAALDSLAAAPALRAVLARKADIARRALLEAAGVVVDARLAEDLLVPGESVEVEVELWNGGPFPVQAATARLELPPGWSATALDPSRGQAGRAPFGARGGARPVGPDGPVPLPPGKAAVWRFRVDVPPDAEPSRLYYLEEARDGEMYRWPEDRSLWALPKGPPLLGGGATFALDGFPVSAGRPAMYVGVDKALGEFRHVPLVVPAVGLSVSPDVVVWPTGAGGERTVSVDLRSFADAGVEGTLTLEAPDGWGVEPQSAPFAFGGAGQSASTAFRVRAPAGVRPGRHLLRAVAAAPDGRRWTEEVDLLDYPHIPRVALFDPAATRVTVAPAAVDDVRVGYVMGSGDAGADALRQLGLDVELLGPEEVRAGDLDRFDVLVLGVRAYETRPDLAGSNERVLDFARRGGTLIVQYNKYEFPQGGFAPFPVEMSRPHDRVTDQRSPVRFLAPRSPVLTSPNRIDEGDFQGWVTERGLYFLGEWDERYTPILELTDPGEDPKRGALLVAPLGEGLYVYTGLSFFRQLPAGVPGAYRLFANLVSLEAEEWRAWQSRR